MLKRQASHKLSHISRYFQRYFHPCYIPLEVVKGSYTILFVEHTSTTYI